MSRRSASAGRALGSGLLREPPALVTAARAATWGLVTTPAPPQPRGATPARRGGPATGAGDSPPTRATPQRMRGRGHRRRTSARPHPRTGRVEPPGVTTKKPAPFGAGFCGALGGIRTPNLLIRSQLLYPLSYERSVGDRSLTVDPTSPLRQTGGARCIATGQQRGVDAAHSAQSRVPASTRAPASSAITWSANSERDTRSAISRIAASWRARTPRPRPGRQRGGERAPRPVGHSSQIT